MRNLLTNEIYTQTLSFFPNNSKPLLVAFDEINEVILIVSSEMKIYIVSTKDYSLQHSIDIEGALSFNSSLMMNAMTAIENKENPFLFITYKPEIDCIILGFSSGDLSTISINEGQSSNISLVSDEKVKLIAMKASPNQEHIIAVLSNYTLLLISYDTLSVINKCSVDDNDLSKVNESDILKEADISFKQNGDLFAVNYNVNNGYKCIVRDMKLNVFKGPARADNKIVFSVAEAPLDYMSSLVSFQPNGSLIAFYNTKTNSVFFSEKNCLVHGHFNVLSHHLSSLKNVIPVFLRWSFDSPMLLLVLRNNDDNKYYIQIYHRSNYEWSLKYESERDIPIIECKFSDIKSNELMIYNNENRVEIISFVFDYVSSLSSGNNYKENNGEICVIDNDIIKYSPLGIINIPPPMALVKVQTKGEKCFWYKNYFFTLSSHVIYVYKSTKKQFELFSELTFDYDKLNMNYIKKVIFVPSYSKKVGVIVINAIDPNKADKEQLIFFLYEISFTEDAYKTIETIHNTKAINIAEYEVNESNRGIIFNSVQYEENYRKDCETKEEVKEELNQKPKQMNLDMLQLDHIGQNIEETNHKVDENIIKFYQIVNDIKQNEIIMNSISLNISTLEVTSHSIDSIVHPNQNEKIIKVSSCMTSNNKELIIYLTQNNKLYQNSKLLSTDINSFVIFKHFLLFTQISSSPYSTLHSIALNNEKMISNLEPNQFNQNLNYKNFNMRTIERGSQIVTCGGINVVLQMPRGNLETISPRLIVLDEIMKLVKQEENYELAFILSRKHKINLNFIYDINPTLFLKNISKFVSQVKKQDYINLFINSLSNDICEEYQILFEVEKTKVVNQTNEETKVNKICSLLRNTLIDLKDDNYINSILISYIKQNPPMYFEALKLVQKLKIDNSSKADKALEFLCWIVKADTLFDFALKTYDFELVIMCAKHTQKDPKEYLSYLNSLEEIKKKDIILMKYQINMDQKYYSDALIEISKGGDKYFDKCLQLIKDHELFELGLSLFNQPINEQLYMKIYDAKGDSYLKDKKYSQASFCYLRSRNYLKAFKCYIETGRVSEALTLLTTNISFGTIENEEYTTDLYENIMTILEICKVKKLSSEIEKVYLFLITNNTWTKFTPEKIQSVSIKIIESLVQIKAYISAYFTCTNLMRILSSNEQYISITSSLSKKLFEEIDLSYNLYYNNLVKNQSYFNEKYNRLLTVQQLKRDHPELFVIDISKNGEEDNVSDSGSVRSQSNKSSKSSMTRKTKMRKPNRTVREGSPMEEENIISILKDLKIDQSQIDGLFELGEVLMMCKYNSKAEEILKQKDSYVKNVNAKIENLFSVEQVKYYNENPIINEIFPELSLGKIGKTSNEKNK